MELQGKVRHLHEPPEEFVPIEERGEKRIPLRYLSPVAGRADGMKEGVGRRVTVEELLHIPIVKQRSLELKGLREGRRLDYGIGLLPIP